MAALINEGRKAHSSRTLELKKGAKFLLTPDGHVMIYKIHSSGTAFPLHTSPGLPGLAFLRVLLSFESLRYEG